MKKGKFYSRKEQRYLEFLELANINQLVGQMTNVTVAYEVFDTPKGRSPEEVFSTDYFLDWINITREKYSLDAEEVIISDESGISVHPSLAIRYLIILASETATDDQFWITYEFVTKDDEFDIDEMLEECKGVMSDYYGKKYK